MRPIVETPEQRFWKLVNKGNSHGCWIWKGCKEKYGHGRFKLSTNKCIYAHRYSYELKNGSIPNGYCICHTCDNPLCVNPNHLWIGTRGQNNTDRKNKGRNAITVGELNPSVKLTVNKVREIRKRLEMGETQISIAKEFGVRQANISSIKLMKSWNNI